MKQYSETHCAVLPDRSSFLPIVANIYTNPSDAQLMATAPELLRALQDMVALQTGKGRITEKRALQNARAVLRKAQNATD